MQHPVLSLLVTLIALGGCTQPRDEARPVPTEVRSIAPSPEPPPPPAHSATLTNQCVVDADCVMTTRRDDCCDHCGNLAVNAASLARVEAQCAKKKTACPAIDCPFQPASARCDKGTCVRRVK